MRYNADFWELENNLTNKAGFKFMLVSVNYFSKWLRCFPFINKETKTVIIEIEKFCLDFGFPQILQIDCRKEFFNSNLKLFCKKNKYFYQSSLL